MIAEPYGAATPLGLLRYQLRDLDGSKVSVTQSGAISFEERGAKVDPWIYALLREFKAQTVDTLRIERIDQEIRFEDSSVAGLIDRYLASLQFGFDGEFPAVAAAEQSIKTAWLRLAGGNWIQEISSTLVVREIVDVYRSAMDGRMLRGDELHQAATHILTTPKSQPKTVNLDAFNTPLDDLPSGKPVQVETEIVQPVKSAAQESHQALFSIQPQWSPPGAGTIQREAEPVKQVDSRPASPVNFRALD